MHTRKLILQVILATNVILLTSIASAGLKERIQGVLDTKKWIESVTNAATGGTATKAEKELKGTYKGMMYVAHDPVELEFEKSKLKSGITEKLLEGSEKVFDDSYSTWIVSSIWGTDRKELLKRISPMALEFVIKPKSIFGFKKYTYYKLSFSDKGKNLVMYGALRAHKLKNDAIISLYMPREKYKNNDMKKDLADATKMFVTLIVPYLKIKSEKKIEALDLAKTAAPENVYVSKDEKLKINKKPVNVFQFANIGNLKNVYPYKVNLKKK